MSDNFMSDRQLVYDFAGMNELRLLSSESTALGHVRQQRRIIGDHPYRWIEYAPDATAEFAKPDDPQRNESAVIVLLLPPAAATGLPDALHLEALSEAGACTAAIEFLDDSGAVTNQIIGIIAPGAPRVLTAALRLLEPCTITFSRLRLRLAEAAQPLKLGLGLLSVSGCVRRAAAGWAGGGAAFSDSGE